MRILIAGLGAIGQRHARNLRGLPGAIDLLAYRQRRLPQLLTDSMGRDDSRSVETILGIEPYTELDAALAAAPDAVFICTPTSQHLALAQRAADAGCHLFIEKPVSQSVEGTSLLFDTVMEKRLVALVGCQWRFHPCVRALKQLLAAGALGELEGAEIDYAEYLPDWHPYEDYRSSYAARVDLGGGVVLTQIHDYDLAYWLFGAPHAVRATGGRLSDLEIDVEDTVEALLETGAGTVRVRQCFASRSSRRSIFVRGTRACATLDLLAARLTVEPPLASGLHLPDYQRNTMFVDEVSHFLRCVAGQESPVIPLSDGITVLRIALAVKESMISGRTVDLT